jgi:hypothetical protein
MRINGDMNVLGNLNLDKPVDMTQSKKKEKWLADVEVYPWEMQIEMK